MFMFILCSDNLSIQKYGIKSAHVKKLMGFLTEELVLKHNDILDTRFVSL